MSCQCCVEGARQARMKDEDLVECGVVLVLCLKKKNKRRASRAFPACSQSRTATGDASPPTYCKTATIANISIFFFFFFFTVTSRVALEKACHMQCHCRPLCPWPKNNSHQNCP